MGCMATTQEKLEAVDAKTEYLVSGYAHRIQRLIQDQIIPQEVIDLCIVYYFIVEFFAIIDFGYWTVSECKRIITRTKGTPSASVYGNVVIPSDEERIYKWKFKILHEETNMRFGISSHWETDCRFSNVTTSHNYAAEHSGGKWSKYVNESFPGFNFDTGDNIEMELNLVSRELLFYKNDRKIGVAYNDIDVGPDIQYRMAIHFRDDKTKAELMDFSCK